MWVPHPSRFLRRVGQEISRKRGATRLWVSKGVRFEVHDNADFRLKSNAGHFLDYLLQLCKTPPEYVHPQDASRYEILLRLLKRFEFPDFENFLPGKVRNLIVGNTTIDRMCRVALLQWVKNYLRSSNDVYPLMAHYALDAAMFVLKHVRGHIGYGQGNEIFRVKGMVKDAETLQNFEPLETRSFKRDFTLNAGGVIAKGTVPEGANISSQTYKEPSYKEGDSFWFRVERCHLSSGIEDHYVYTTAESPERNYDINEEFKFFGHLLIPHHPGEIQPKGWRREIPTFVPARWFSHAFRENSLVRLPWEPAPEVQ